MYVLAPDPGGTQPAHLPELAGRTVATMVVTTPPGIPVLVPGECAGDDDSPIPCYLRVLEAFDRQFPGFPSETHGVTRQDTGDYWITCLRLTSLGTNFGPVVPTIARVTDQVR